MTPILGTISSGISGNLFSAWGSYFAGGDTTSNIDKILHSNETISLLSATLAQNVTFAASHSNNKSSGYVTFGGSNIVNKIAYVTDTRSTTSSMPSTLARCYGFANSGQNGYVMGGNQTSIWRHAYSNDTITAISGTFPRSSNERAAASSNNGVAGYILGGGDNDGSCGSSDVIVKLTFSSEAISTLSATLSAKKRTAAGLANSGVASYCIGGYNNCGLGVGTTTDKLSHSTETRSVISATVPSLLLAISCGAASNNGVAGYIAAGEDGFGGTGAKNQVGKLNFSNDTFSVLSAGTWSSATASQGKSGFANSQSL